jgi:antitoxin component YwqK of YwqJK toxin-antitoxin module
MKIIRSALIFIFVIAVCGPAKGQQPVSKDKIKSIVVYEEKFNVLVSKKLKESEVTYDQKGNILEEIEYKEGKVTKHFRYQYDNDDNKVKEEEFDPSGKLIEYSEYKIENGRRIEKNVFDANKKLKSRKTYQYSIF